MCGFAGFLSKKDMPIYPNELLKKMGLTIKNRGPDSSGEWLDETSKIGLSHRRLAIVDLTNAGHQPMLSPSKRFVISYNGEVYNHLDLRKELEVEGVKPAWAGHSDTETLLAGFEYWGVRLTIEKSVGMFAFAVWDCLEKRLILGRDRLGEKPIYYGWQNDSFLFGSELKALKVHPAFKSEINRDAIPLLLRHNYIPAPYSIYTGIFKLLPGHLLEIDTADYSVETHEYWSLQNVCDGENRKDFGGSPVDSVDALEKILRGAIKKQMMADVPLGAFLSGGIDSSTVVALMQDQAEIPVKTFSIGFHEEGYNEAVHAKAISSHLGTEHTELYVTSEDALAVIPQLAELYDEPFSDPSQIPTFLVSKMAREKVTVSLSGDGGDELFSGYSRYIRINDIWSKVSKIPKPLRGLVSIFLRMFPATSWDKFNQRFLTKLGISNLGYKMHKAAKIITAESIAVFYNDMVSHSYAPEQLVLNTKEPETVFTCSERKFDIDSGIEEMMALDTVSYLPNDILTKIDRASMGVSLEGRIPFLSHDVVEFAWALPLNYKFREGEAKWCLKEVLYRYVPKSLVDRPKKGFGVPIGAWLRGPLREWASLLLDDARLRSEGIFDPELVSAMWEEHISETHDWQGKLWDILMFQAWYEKNHKFDNASTIK